MARILMVASEAAPFAKTGGLADVLGGLPPALRELGEDVAVVIPKYRAVELHQPERIYNDLPVWVGTRAFPMQIDRVVHNGVPYLFLNCPPLYDRPGIYNIGGVDFPDNHIRFAALCRAAMEIVRRIFRASIIHCHDWQAGLLPVYLRRLTPADPTFIGVRTLFTIHNLGYQGRFLPLALPDLGLDSSLFRPDALEYHGDINFLQGGLVFSDALSTVSRAYAREIQTPAYGFGLDPILRARSRVLHGILNGVDYTLWSPETDRHLPANYTQEDLDGKAVCKRALLERFGLPPENNARPVLGIVSRFATQKGFDLISDIATELMQEDVAVTVLGSGEARYEDMFRDLSAAYPDRVGVQIGYDDPLAHLIEGGADMFLMPSQYEPCGLNQIYSLRYGTVPVVRATGGLDDTIDEDTGFKFQPYTGQAFLTAIRAALAAYADRPGWTAMMERGMQQDYSWTASARKYSELYRGISAA